MSWEWFSSSLGSHFPGLKDEKAVFKTNKNLFCGGEGIAGVEVRGQLERWVLSFELRSSGLLSHLTNPIRQSCNRMVWSIFWTISLVTDEARVVLWVSGTPGLKTKPHLALFLLHYASLSLMQQLPPPYIRGAETSAGSNALGLGWC